MGPRACAPGRPSESRYTVSVAHCYVHNVIILAEQYRFILPATIQTRVFAGHSAAVAYTAREPTGSDERYWSLKVTILRNYIASLLCT